MKKSRIKSVLAMSAFLISFAITVLVSAQARVIVEVRSPSGDVAEGTITLTPVNGGASISCQTRQGTCEISQVAGGQYTATLRPQQGNPPTPRTVVIPPSGRVTLRISTR